MVVGANLIQDIFVPLSAANFRGKIIQLAVKLDEVFQNWAARIRAGKPANAETGEEVERSERQGLTTREQSPRTPFSSAWFRIENSHQSSRAVPGG
jgi:hypothetical protein